ncbi:MAG TPA: competence/damage-inducible protein A [Gemmatimonadaceae bacterium]|nr:competence/damage-inducible protein A [Gemmatimonadaceae bacterium]
MRVEILTIGAELLLGYTIDTNAAFMARALSEIGVAVVRHDTVGDDPELIARAIRDGLERTGAVITSGGLGPTADDRTRDGLAAAFGRELVTDPEALSQVERRFRLFGRTMPKINVVQALVPRGARVLENRFGSAPALWMEDERGRWVITLPGVPSEMRGLLTETVIPILREREGGAAPTVVASKTIRTTGIGESALAELLGEDGGDAVAGLPLAYLPGWEGVDLRITAAEMPVADAERALAEATRRLRERAGTYIYGEDAADLAAVVLDLCRERSLTIAIAESCTGGLIGARLTAVPGSSDVFVGGVVAYANSIKQSMLGVPEELIRRVGAVSEEVAKAMAAGARERTGADVGIAVTGIAGPGGGSAEKPVGTVWVAVQIGEDVRTFGRVYLGDRGEVRSRAAQAALDTARGMLTQPR